MSDHEETTPSQAPDDGLDPVRGADAGRLLDVLLYEGVLPRYAFPTDVAAFYVFDLNAGSSFRPSFRFSPQQSLATALSQYAPGKEVWIANQRFISGAIYSPYEKERREAWERRRLYYECVNCGYAITKPFNSGARGEVLTCGACGAADSLGPARIWFRPPGFAHPIDIEPGTTPDDALSTAYPTRAKLEAPSPLADDERWRDISPGIRVLGLHQKLLVTNAGPRREGYNYCVLCGRIEPTVVHESKLFASHKLPYPSRRGSDCKGGGTAREVCLGTDYVTDILLLELTVQPPVVLKPGVLGTQVALRTLSEAVARAACITLDLEPGEVEAEFRPAVSSAGPTGEKAEIFLYDTLPGGAGFTRRVGEDLQSVLERARQILAGCSCDSSCYKCLRTFKNRFEHDRLHRLLGLELLELILYGTMPVVPSVRRKRAVSLLAEDLARQADGGLHVETDVVVVDSAVGAVEVPLVVSAGPRRVAVAVTHPLSPHVPDQPKLRALAENGTSVAVKCIHELQIERALPWATKQVLDLFAVA